MSGERRIQESGGPFPRAADFFPSPPDSILGVAEPTSGWEAERPCERALQCVWFDPGLRPGDLTTTDGRPVAVLNAGRWNLEAGPDFIGAVVRIGGAPPQSGDVEVHLHSAAWSAHGHARDPRYRNVRFHVVLKAGKTPAAALPTPAAEIELGPALARQPGFSFAQIDLAAYPFGRRASPPPCAAVLSAWHPDRIEALLAAAGEARLRDKARRLERLARGSDMDQVVYAEFLAALGYKHNAAPFRRLAAALPLRVLRDRSAGDADRAFALLAGVADLLPSEPPGDTDDAARRWWRAAWETWWGQRAHWSPPPLARTDWRLAGVRPLNHPLRRLMAAAWLFTRPETPWQTVRRLAREQPDGWDRAADEDLAKLGPTCWDDRLTFSGPPLERPAALLGPDRRAALLINLWIPALAAAGDVRAISPAVLDRLPAGSGNERIRTVAHALFGPHHPVSWYRSGLKRQGLLRIFHDFCLPDRTACAACPLPAWLAARKEPTP